MSHDEPFTSLVVQL